MVLLVVTLTLNSTYVHEAVAWQRLEMRLLFCQSPPTALIELIDDPFKKATIGTNTFEIRRSPQFDGLLNPVLERTMRIFYGAVFMADAQVIDRWLHAVVLTQRLISLREFLFLVRIAVSGTQAVGAMFLGRAA